MWPNPQVPADLVAFTEDLLNGKLHFLCSTSSEKARLLCDFPFGLNPGDKPTDAQAWNNYTQKVRKTSSKQIQRKIDGTLKRGSKIKPTKY